MALIYNKKFNNAPEGTIYVGRPTKYGNMFTHINSKRTQALHIVSTVQEAVNSYANWLRESFPDLKSPQAAEFFAPLVGKDLECWCAPKEPILHISRPLICHAQVLAFYAEAYSLMTHNP